MTIYGTFSLVMLKIINELEFKRKSLGGFIYKCDRFDYVNL